MGFTSWSLQQDVANYVLDLAVLSDQETLA